MSLARITHKKKKSLHTFDEKPFFINCKKLCHFRHTNTNYLLMKDVKGYKIFCVFSLNIGGFMHNCTCI